MSETVQVISKLDPATDSPFLGDTRLLIGEHVVEFKGGRATVPRDVAARLRGHRHVDVFGLDDVAPPVGVIEQPNSSGSTADVNVTTTPAPEPKTLAELVAEASDEERAALLAALSPAQPPAPAAPLVEPWEGYNGLNAKDAVKALADKTPEQLAAVKAYEQANKVRGTVIAACGVLTPREPGDSTPITEADLPEGATIGPDGTIELADNVELTDEQKQRIADAQAYLAEEGATGNA